MKLRLGEARIPVHRLHTRITTLEALMEGFDPGELITISGLTKHGKTLLAQTLTKHFCDMRYYPLWFSYEVPARQFLNQFPSLPIFYLPDKLKAHDLNWVEDRIDEARAKYDVRVCFIDHLHFLFDMVRSRNTSLDIGNVVRSLKRFAVEKEMVIFLLCHLAKIKKGEDPSYFDLRDSSLIAQESDSVLMVKRTEEEGDNTALIKVEFHRRTGVMDKLVKVVKWQGYLWERKEA
ncbi:MAG: DnaB-like helicase C-terminal domain-containing protein [Thermodesulfobacteriota bacterium]